MYKLMSLTILLTFITLSVHAGNLVNGQWQPVNCGQKTPPPAINTQSVDAFNQSIKDINAWQAKAQEYYNCVVKEANVDNQIIATSANAAQQEFKNEVSRIQKEADAGKAKVEKD
ncbi:hypothetical protein MCAMS1_01976 [biofilm metagenome]